MSLADARFAEPPKLIQRLDLPALPAPPVTNPVELKDDHDSPVEEEHDNTVEVLFSKKKTIVLQGLFFGLHFHGEELLKTQVKGISEGVFNRLKNRLEILMRDIDEKYKVRDLRGGSSWEGYGAKVDEKEDDVTLGLKLRIFPQSYLNKLRALRGELTQERLRRCITLEGETSGRYKQNLYILPYGNAPAMIAKIAEANTEINDLNVKIQEYLQSIDFANVRDVLREFQMEHIINGKTWNVGQVTYEAFELSLNPATVMSLVKTARGTIRSELKDAERRGMEQLQQDLERREREMITGSLAKLKEELNANVTKIVAGIKRNPDKVKEELDNIRNKARCIGLSALADSVINPLEALIDDPDKAEELFGTINIKDVPDIVNGRIKGLIESL